MTLTIKNPLPKVVALILMSVGVAWLLGVFDTIELAKMNSMTAAEFFEKHHQMYHRSFAFHFICMFLLGGLYVGVLGLLTTLLGLFSKKKPLAESIIDSAAHR